MASKLLFTLLLAIATSASLVCISASSHYPYSISNHTLSKSVYSHSYLPQQSRYTGCYSNHCRNNGVCVPNEQYCRCPPKYVGAQCQYPNPCYGNNRCYNGGTCQPIIAPDQPPTFRCECPLGYTASMCEVEVDNICKRTKPCANDGRCVLKGNLETFECQCAIGWRGQLCKERDNCSAQPCKNGATCLSNKSGFTCKCAAGFRGPTCAEDIDECGELGEQACHHNGVCINTPGSYRCTCEQGFTGARCESRYVPCETNPCLNDGECVPHYQTSSYHCRCPSGFKGKDCEINIDDCGGHLCQNGGTCLDGVNTYTCLCPSNFSGPYCSQDVDECALRPHICQNGATCANTVGGFSCICVNGWTGPTCAENIDDCAEAPCFNGGTCHDRVGSFYCKCPEGKTGLLCHLDDACASSPCHDSAICDTSPVDGTYRCSCPPGFEGTDCTKDIDECHDSGSPCEHGGTCVNTPGSFRCDCAVGFTGARCEVNINECDSNPCQNEGTCLDERGSYRCVCMPGYTGIHCETNIDECQSSPCQNNAICTDLINGYRCLCMPGFDGTNCEQTVDQCFHNMCRNGGTCHNEFQTPSRASIPVCTCPEGFTGRLCEFNVNDCESNPCINGKCQDMVNSFKCICDPGYTGYYCQTQINECNSSPCENGGSCYAKFPGYKCECPNGTSGNNCQYNDNECWSNPCLNGGTCHDLTGRYKCQCLPGFHGDQCEINECNSNPCANGGTCYHMSNGYKCICPKGFSGPRCMAEIDECAAEPCLNGGTCEDGINHFICHCPPGYSGYRCEENFCTKNTCHNGGTCIEHLGQCRCAENYSGMFCEERKRADPWKNCSKADFCAPKFADKYCNDECNTRECLFDGGDCRYNGRINVNFNTKYQMQTCNHSDYCEDNFANGHCDYGCDNAACAWDGLDCEKDLSDLDSRGELIVDIDQTIPQGHRPFNATYHPKIVKRLLFQLSSMLDSVLRLREIQPNGQMGSKLVLSINNRKCSHNEQCFENSRDMASYISQLQQRDSPVNEFLRANNLQMRVSSADSEREIDDNRHSGKQVHSLTYVVLVIMSLLFIGILFGVLVTNNRRKIVRGTTWFPDGFFTNQMAPMSHGSRHHHHSNASANAAAGDFGRNRRFGLSHSNSVRSGCPDGQEMRQFKSRDDLIDEKSACAAIYEEPTDCRSWSSAHYDAYQLNDSMTPPLPSMTPSIDAIGPNGMTPLMVASAFPNPMMLDKPENGCADSNSAVQDLLMNGADVSLTCDKTSETSLHLAARYARADAAKRLIEGGADVNAQDETGRSPLHAAIGSDALGVFEIIIRNHLTNLNSKTNTGTTPLILAARLANEGMLEQLVLSNCDLNLYDNSGKTALHWAASVNNVEAVRILLQHGADRDAKDNREETPLFLAAREGAYQCAKLLLDYHANRDITDHMDRLPRDVALERMHTDIVALLDEYEPPKVPPTIITLSNNVTSNSGGGGGGGGGGQVANQWGNGVGGTLGRNAARRKNGNHQHQLSTLSQMSAQHYQSSNNLNTSSATLATTLSSTGTLKKSTPHVPLAPTGTTAPPLPPPRNCVSLYNAHANLNAANAPQPILLLGSGAPDSMMNGGGGGGGGVHNGQYGTTSPNYTTGQTNATPSNTGMPQTPQQMNSPFYDFSPPNSMLTTSALISPPSRAPPAYEECFKQHQQQPIAVAPRHVINQSQPLTPTATTAPTLAYSNNNTLSRFPMGHTVMGHTVSQQQQVLQQQQQSAQQPTMHSQPMHQQQRPPDSYPTPSPDSWGSLSTSSPLSAHDWTANNGLEMIANTPSATMMANASHTGTAGTQPTLTMMLSPSMVASTVTQTNPRFQPSSTQQAVFI